MRFLTDGGVHSTKLIDGYLKNLGQESGFPGTDESDSATRALILFAD